jgi:hypothetical protein
MLAGLSLNGWCQQDAGQTPEIYAKVWGALGFYHDEDNPTIQSFSLVGRYHGQ